MGDENTADLQSANEKDLEKLNINDEEKEQESTVNAVEINGTSAETNLQDVNHEDSDDDSRKLFVGGLSYETDANDLKEYFSKWGKVTQSLIKFDRNTGCSRGFGFVTLESEQCVSKILEVTEHKLKNRKIDPKRAKPSREPMKKIFVGGIDPDLSEEQIRTYFSQFGVIDSLDLPFDSQKGKRKNYIFVCFTTGGAAKKAIAKERQEICGKQCDVRLAVTREQASRQKAMKHYGSMFESGAVSTTTPYHLSNYFGDLLSAYAAAPPTAALDPYSAAAYQPYYTTAYDYYAAAANPYQQAAANPADYVNLFRGASGLKPLGAAGSNQQPHFQQQQHLQQQQNNKSVPMHPHQLFMQQQAPSNRTGANKSNSAAQLGPNAAARFIEDHRCTPPRIEAHPAGIMYHTTNGPSIAPGQTGTAPVMDHDFTGMWQTTGPTPAFQRT